MKHCKDCDQDRPLEDFYVRSDTGKRRSNCRFCMSAKHVAWRKENRDRVAATQRQNYSRHSTPERRRRNHLWSTHRITLEGFDDLYVAQDGRCAICWKEQERRQLAVDHDHACCSGRRSCGACIRGLLCDNCNRGLGMFADNPDLLRAAVRYITPGVN